MIESARPLAETYDVALLDLDGVVYVGEDPVPGVPLALAEVRAAGMRLGFVTNNASRTPAQVVALLARMHVPAQGDEVITSSHAAAHYLADVLTPGSPVLIIGTTGLIEAIAERGLKPVFSADEAPAAVVQGFSPDIDWKSLAEGMVAIRAGARWVATNLDPSVPSPRGPLPGNGALVAALRTASGHEPESTGKPDPRMHAESVQRSGARNPIVVGDRLDTDIEGAKRVGCASLLVLTGVTDAAQLLAAPEQHRPEFIGRDAGALLLAHPTVTSTADQVSCGRARVRTDGRRLIVTSEGGGGDGLDVLRALAHASWSQTVPGSPPGRPGQPFEIIAGDRTSRSELDALAVDHR
ncbi:MAG: family hydrolase [Frankiales bacterium]|nr:family hydrolase [Frankiales bacterium]